MKITLEIDEALWTEEVDKINANAILSIAKHNQSAEVNHLARMKATPDKDKTKFSPTPDPFPLSIEDLVKTKLSSIEESICLSQKQSCLKVLSQQSPEVLKKLASQF